MIDGWKNERRTGILPKPCGKEGEGEVLLFIPSLRISPLQSLGMESTKHSTDANKKNKINQVLMVSFRFASTNVGSNTS